MVQDRRVNEEMINYRNRMDSFIASFITVPPVHLLKKKDIEFRRECLASLLLSSKDIRLTRRLDRHLVLLYDMIEEALYTNCD